MAEPAGEEFLVFREFWIEAADPGAKDVVIHALMDSPSLTGACQFRITKGAVTTMDFSAGLFPRVALAAVGLAPDTSMFLFSDINRRRFDDFRKAAHDSDGLLMLNGAGEMLWRPLNNPAGVKISAFADSGTRGFGPCSARDIRATMTTLPRITNAVPRFGWNRSVTGAKAGHTGRDSGRQGNQR